MVFTEADALAEALAVAVSIRRIEINALGCESLAMYLMRKQYIHTYLENQSLSLGRGLGLGLGLEKGSGLGWSLFGY